MAHEQKVILINCSPRRNGNSERAAERIARNLLPDFNTHPVRIHDLSINPCGDCDKFCEKTGRCRLKDDMEILYSLFDSSAALILVSPVYFYNLPGYAKIMIDRCQPYWILKKENRPPRARIFFSAAVMIGATRGSKLFVGMKQVFNSFSSVLGVEHVHPHHVLEIRRVDARGEIDSHMEEIDRFSDMLKEELSKLSL